MAIYKGLTQIRHSQTFPDHVIEKHRRSPLNKDRVREEPIRATAPPHFKFVYPEFLPDPLPYRRDVIREKLERRDMLKRRAQIDIPEFYVGSILSVTLADIKSETKSSRFVGLCTERGGHGMRAWFTLRNHVRGHGVEITYNIYHPKIQEIKCLKLEKRLDDSMPYLKDAPSEYSTIPFDFRPVLHPPGAPVPVNTTKVKMNPYPWFSRWEIRGFKGIDFSESGVWEKRLVRMRHPQNVRAWERYDLMKWYRESIDDETAAKVMREVKVSVDQQAASRSRAQEEAAMAAAAATVREADS